MKAQKAKEELLTDRTRGECRKKERVEMME